MASCDSTAVTAMLPAPAFLAQPDLSRYSLTWWECAQQKTKASSTPADSSHVSVYSIIGMCTSGSNTCEEEAAAELVWGLEVVLMQDSGGR